VRARQRNRAHQQGWPTNSAMTDDEVADCFHQHTTSSLEYSRNFASAASSSITQCASNQPMRSDGASSAKRPIRRCRIRTRCYAYYLWNDRTFPPTEQHFRVDPNLWPKAEADPSFLRGRAESKVSYFWDRLIEYVTGHYLGEALEFGNEMEMADHERLVRIMAGETRLFRRILSNMIFDCAAAARNRKSSGIRPARCELCPLCRARRSRRRSCHLSTIDQTGQKS
jgi:hypothetical protein